MYVKFAHHTWTFVPLAYIFMGIHVCVCVLYIYIGENEAEVLFSHAFGKQAQVCYARVTPLIIILQV